MPGAYPISRNLADRAVHDMTDVASTSHDCHEQADERFYDAQEHLGQVHTAQEPLDSEGEDQEEDDEFFDAREYQRYHDCPDNRKKDYLASLPNPFRREAPLAETTIRPVTGTSRAAGGPQAGVKSRKRGGEVSLRWDAGATAEVEHVNEEKVTEQDATADVVDGEAAVRSAPSHKQAPIPETTQYTVTSSSTAGVAEWRSWKKIQKRQRCRLACALRSAGRRTGQRTVSKRCSPAQHVKTKSADGSLAVQVLPSAAGVKENDAGLEITEPDEQLQPKESAVVETAAAKTEDVKADQQLLEQKLVNGTFRTSSVTMDGYEEEEEVGCEEAAVDLEPCLCCSDDSLVAQLTLLLDAFHLSHRRAISRDSACTITAGDTHTVPISHSESGYGSGDETPSPAAKPVGEDSIPAPHTVDSAPVLSDIIPVAYEDTEMQGIETPAVPAIVDPSPADVPSANTTSQDDEMETDVAGEDCEMAGYSSPAAGGADIVDRSIPTPSLAPEIEMEHVAERPHLSSSRHASIGDVFVFGGGISQAAPAPDIEMRHVAERTDLSIPSTAGIAFVFGSSISQTAAAPEFEMQDFAAPVAVPVFGMAGSAGVLGSTTPSPSQAPETEMEDSIAVAPLPMQASTGSATTVGGGMLEAVQAPGLEVKEATAAIPIFAAGG